MSIVKVKTKGQVTIPTILRQQAGLNIGDFLETKIEGGNIVLKPQTLVDRHIAESIEQFKDGQSFGPFNTAEEMIASLKKNMKPQAVKKSKRA
jgi:AbrB family looped-hinge helix DNA binding protein